MEAEAALLKMLSDPTRLRLTVALALRGETCVCILAGELGEPQYKISRHLALMRASGLVHARREGTWMHYSLSEPRTGFERELLGMLSSSLAEDPAVKAVLVHPGRTCCGTGGCDG